jgi:hypothetical protein
MHSLPRSLAVLAALVTAGVASAGTPHVWGPLVLRNADGEYVGVSADTTRQAHAVRRPGGDEFAYLWPADRLESLLKEDLAIVAMPADGHEGNVTNQRGECLSLKPLASSPSWLSCEDGFPRQVWLHRQGVLSMERGVLDFVPYASRRGLLAESKGQTNFRVVSALLHPVTETETQPAGLPH